MIVSCAHKIDSQDPFVISAFPLDTAHVFPCLAGRYLAKVGDFGGCCTEGGTPRAATEYFSAPEAHLFQPVNARSDVYSVGIMAILLLSGRFEESDLPELDSETFFNVETGKFWTHALCERRSS